MLGGRVERLARRRTRRRAVRLSVAFGLAAGGAVAASVTGATGATPDAAAVLADVDNVEPQGMVEGQAAAIAPATFAVLEPNVGVWVVEGVSGRMANLLNAPTGDRTYAETQYGLSLRRVIPASVVLKGKLHDVWTNAETVQELLSAMGVEPDWNDRVSPSLQAPITTRRVRFVDVRVARHELHVTVPYETVVIHSSALAPGETEVLEPGSTGERFEVWKVRTHDGKEVGRTLLERRTIRAAVTRRVRVGMEEQATQGQSQVGEASWYDPPWSGLTAAHPWLPFGTKVTVTNLDNGKSVTVTINDRGPFGGRIIDLSREAFELLAPLGQGVCKVRLTW
jgi:hypothetical protein